MSLQLLEGKRGYGLLIFQMSGAVLDPRGAPDGRPQKLGIDATKILVEKEMFERAVIPEE